MNSFKLYLLCGIILIVACSLKKASSSESGQNKAIYDNSKGLVQNCADPYVLEYDGTYYLYGTGGRSGIKVYTSTDLANWS